MTNYEYGIDFLTLIANRNDKDELLEFLIESECHLINVVYAKGSLKSGYLKDMLGLVPEEKKVLITCLISSNLSNQLLEQLIIKFNFNKPNTGIAFVIPVNTLSV